MKNALLREDFDEFTELIGDGWENQKALDASVTNETIEKLFTAAVSAGALSGKACGAGGGGCLLFVAEPQNRSAITSAITSLGARAISFHFEFEGLKVEREG